MRYYYYFQYTGNYNNYSPILYILLVSIYIWLYTLPLYEYLPTTKGVALRCTLPSLDICHLTVVSYTEKSYSINGLTKVVYSLESISHDIEFEVVGAGAQGDHEE